MGDYKLKFLVIFIAFILFSFNVFAEEWRHPDCPKDFEGYKEEYGIPRWEFESLFEKCYWTKEEYEAWLVEENDHKEGSCDNPANKRDCEEARAQVEEWAKNPPPLQETPPIQLPPTPPPPPGSKPEEFGKWISPEESRMHTSQNKHKLWWFEKAKIWKEEKLVVNESSIYYNIQNFKNNIVRKSKSIWSFLFE